MKPLEFWRKKPLTVMITCFSCETRLRVTLGCPGEIEDVEEMWEDGLPRSSPDGCQHGWNNGDYTKSFYRQVAEAEQEHSEAAYDREMDSRMERERERVHEWERYYQEEGGEQ